MRGGTVFWAVSVSEGQKKSSWVSEVCDFNSQNHTDQINHDKTNPYPSFFFLHPQRSAYLGDRPRSVSVEIREKSVGIRVLSANARWQNPPTKSTFLSVWTNKNSLWVAAFGSYSSLYNLIGKLHILINQINKHWWEIRKCQNSWNTMTILYCSASPS